jgi:hypothetical protein
LNSPIRRDSPAANNIAEIINNFASKSIQKRLRECLVKLRCHGAIWQVICPLFKRPVKVQLGCQAKLNIRQMILKAPSNLSAAWRIKALTKKRGVKFEQVIENIYCKPDDHHAGGRR